MRIVRPYGESRVEAGSDGPRRRRLVDTTPERRAHDIPAFASGHDALVIAQWISVLDRIATKPMDNNGPTDRQRAFRDRLGAAAWEQIGGSDRIGRAEREHLQTLWQFKTHPYGNTKYTARKGKKGKTKPPDPRGRWYRRFAGDVAPEQADVRAIARLMDRHLHVAELRIDPDRPDKVKGAIAARARSIADNVPQQDRRPAPSEWDERTLNRYFAAGDVARKIFEAARDREQGRNGVSEGPVRRSFAAELLHEHFGRLFGPEVEKIEQARARDPALLALHMAVRDAYRKLIKRRAAPKNKRLAQMLPRHRRELLRLLGHHDRNRELAALIRRGKLIHYTAADLAAQDAGGAQEPGDRPAHVLTHWPDDLSTSRYLTSAGQSAIKRSEAFVRHWRHTIAMTALTLRDWASMERDIGDVLGRASKVQEATGRRNFCATKHDAKVRLLFGARASLFPSADDADRKALLASVIRAGIKLRNSSFHFTGRGGFLAALHGLGSEDVLERTILDAAHALWHEDAVARAGRVRTSLTAVHSPLFFDESRNRLLLDLLEKEPGQHGEPLPLPRFVRMLTRAKYAWKGKARLRLPETANRQDLKDPACVCRYVVLKMLYERPFRDWLAARTPGEVNGWIDKALKRSTSSAQTINGKRLDDAQKALIVAKANSLPRLSEGRRIHDFFYDLSSATAAEMRVQRGYGHDGAAAREQASHIDDLLCDVVALAFEEWLHAPHDGRGPLTWLTDLQPGTPRPGKQCDLDQIGNEADVQKPEDWQAALYLVFHLVPVGEASRLLHQLAKWSITSQLSDTLSQVERQSLTALIQTLLLYLDMHDAKFEGNEALTGYKPFEELFQSPEGFNRIFPANIENPLEGRIPKRGLREIMRFGHRHLVASLAQQDTIMDAEVDEFLRAETGTGEDSIAELQTKREDVHKAWQETKASKRGREKPKITPDKLRHYVRAVADIARHRRMAARVTLTDLVTLHRLLMSVMGRLADFAGMFERDLYFAMLGCLATKRTPLHTVLDQVGQDLMSNGQIIEALRTLPIARNGQAKENEGYLLAAKIEALFGRSAAGLPAIKPRQSRNMGDSSEFSGAPALSETAGFNFLSEIRNDLSHLNSLHQEPANLNLTALVNRARTLMSYDRKLKNAVSLSIKELLERESLLLRWSIAGRYGTAEAKVHEVADAKIKGKTAKHLGGWTLRLKACNDAVAISENLCSDHHLNAVARLFAGSADISSDVVDLDLDAVAWTAPNEQGERSQAEPSPSKQKGRKTARRRLQYLRQPRPRGHN